MTVQEVYLTFSVSELLDQCSECGEMRIMM